MNTLHSEAYRAFVSFAAHQRIATVQGECAMADNWSALPEPVRDAIAADYEAFNADVERTADQLNSETTHAFDCPIHGYGDSFGCPECRAKTTANLLNQETYEDS